MTEAEKPVWNGMWKDLGIDLEKHDELLSVLPGIYKSVYIDSQSNRPGAMAFWDMVVGDIHGIRVKEIVDAKKQGKKVVGTFCLYVPDEIIEALGAICVGLCGGTNFSNYAVEGLLPAGTCPLIKSALGFAFGRICPYYQGVDLLVGETTCDGKKKAWEVLGKEKPMHVVDLPQVKERPAARQHFISELKLLVDRLEKLTGNTLEAGALKEAMRKVQQKRALLRRIYQARAADPPPISGKDALLVSQVAFYDDLDREIEMLGKLAAELEQRVREGVGVVPPGTKRIVLSGTPQAIPNWKVHDMVETSGAVIVAEETCTGTRYFQGEYEVKGDTVDELLERLADRYLGINCACFTPNDGRLEDIKRLVEETRADGVILYSLSFCQPYEHEAMNIERELKEAGIRVLQVSTDYSSEDAGALKSRIEAFIETL